MKVLFDCPMPFQLAHGGAEIQINQTKRALESIGVEVDWLRWWDPDQKADIIHYFSRPSADYILLAHQKNIRVVVAELLTGLASRPASARTLQKLGISLLPKMLPGEFSARLGWRSFRLADACVALTAWEAQLMSEIFEAPRERVHVIPNGVEEVFLNAPAQERGPWLVSTSTITPRKRVLEAAAAAVAAKTPLWVIGRPYSETDAYGRRFIELARRHPAILRYEGPISDRAKLAEIYRTARGFVLLSTMESLSLSALEAAACGCPLLLSDLPWARTTFASKASYTAIGSQPSLAKDLAAFYEKAPQLSVPSPPASWTQVAEMLKSLYAGLLKTSP